MTTRQVFTPTRTEAAYCKIFTNARYLCVTAQSTGYAISRQRGRNLQTSRWEKISTLQGWEAGKAQDHLAVVASQILIGVFNSATSARP